MTVDELQKLTPYERETFLLLTKIARLLEEIASVGRD